ncbi:hypothetical protein [Rhizomonospora bruguierae]|uniref:hypothetical protein n=1 Tax=Rhizomonospora bruguierae TaxID=1581705 RepID=UPI001BCCD289|nr:hypothetical protein [Micromonospora sp. NBRC 107566]
MASGIRSMLRGGGSGGSGGVVRHTVGNALVLHVEDGISAEAQSLALSMIEDTENDVVVLDLGSGPPIGSWEAMAAVLPRHRRGIRLVACGQQRNATAMAGQWLSERLRRTVIAPDGELVRGSAGALFVHSTAGSGWVRFRPGRPPTWDAKRYPAPVWDTAATERQTSSSTGEIEPLPGGVWIHDVRDPETVGAHRRRLVADVPCQPERMTVLLGCPGTAPLSLDDVVRFWRDLDEESRARTRFVRYGDVRMPAGEAFGQALADLLGTTIVCYTGVPLGSPHKYEIRTARQDGTLGWAPFALELSYAPRAHPNSKARRPTVLSHRAPLAWAEEIAPRVYWYAPDAVVEVVHAGLWVRPTEEPANAERVRAAALYPEGNTLVFDDTVDTRADRMRELAQDLNARLDQTAGVGGALFPASVFRPGTARPGPAQAWVEVAPVAVETHPADAPPEESARSSVDASLPPPPPAAPMVASMLVGQITVGDPVGEVQPEVRALSEAADAPPLPEPAQVQVVLPEPVQIPVAEPLPVPPVANGAAAPAAEEVAAPVVDGARGAGRVRHQPVPASGASALLPSRPPEEERRWLRRTLSREFDAMASSVSRIMSEHPGMQGHSVAAEDVLADSVAVRLYLSRRGEGIDAGLRSGRNGPHVPFARCVVSGLSRLPSFRGTTIYRLSPDEPDWELYTNRRLLTDWSFVNALSGPCSSQEGDTDVLIWSMTARRTALLEPAGDEAVVDRVVFLPGTSFKILQTRRASGARRGAILLREIGANEIDDDGRVDPDRVSLDELAVTSLRRSVERWDRAEGRRRIGPASGTRFAILPGLERPGPERVG